MQHTFYSQHLWIRTSGFERCLFTIPCEWAESTLCGNGYNGEHNNIPKKKLKRKTSESQKEEKIISPRWIKWNECGNIPVEYTSFCKNVYHLNCSLGFSPLIHTSWFLHPFRTVHSKTTWIVCFGWQNVCKKYFTTCSHFHSSSVDCLHSNPPKATDCR